MAKKEAMKAKAGPEMDALVAKKAMGWTYGQAGVDYSGWMGKEVSDRARHGHFSPSTDIAAAMEVAEKLKGEYLCFTLYFDNIRGGWLAAFGALLDKSPISESAALAICRAALLVIPP